MTILSAVLRLHLEAPLFTSLLVISLHALVGAGNTAPVNIIPTTAMHRQNNYESNKQQPLHIE